jgi:8-oxo-dGTP pyrophosphatase MutT (NUDIX family)
MVKQKREISKVKKGKPVRQVAALPYRREPDGAVRLLLITSRTTNRFILPKGWKMKNRSLAEAARIEAEEEAGVKGRIDKKPLGTYSYWKRLKSAFVPIIVTVFGLEVTGLVEDWQEGDQRERAWLSRDDAARLVDEPELATLIAEFEPEPH